MDDAAVLHAGTSHWAWDDAVVHLMSCGLEKDAAESWLLSRHWALTRVPDQLYARLTENILSYGLWGEVKLACSDWHNASALVMLHFTPSRHWIHLLSPDGLRMRDIAAYPYHVSICYMKDLWGAWDVKRPLLRALEEKYGASKTVNLPIESFGSGASALIGDCELRRDLMPLWQSGSESYKSGLHISL